MSFHMIANLKFIFFNFATTWSRKIHIRMVSPTKKKSFLSTIKLMSEWAAPDFYGNKKKELVGWGMACIE